MIRLRVVAVAAATSLAFAAVAVPVASAANGTGSQSQAYSHFPALYTVAVKGTAKNGKQFTGKFGIQRVVARGQTAYAVGTLKGTLGGQRVTRYGVMMPASLTGAPSGSARDAAACPVLHLVLGPITLNLLGLVVTLGGGPQMNQPIVLDITAVSGQGNLLGNLLCGVSNLLNSGSPSLLSQVQRDVQALTAELNSLLATLSL